MKTTDGIRKTVLVSAAALIVAAAFLLFYQKGAFLSDSINWQEDDFAFEEGRIIIENRTATLYYNGGKVWQSSWKFNVQQCMGEDIDGDGVDELIMLVWKRGNYGRHMPFWVEKNDNDLAQHIFIYKWEDSRPSKLRAIWMSSAVSDKFDSMSTDSKGELFIKDTNGNVSAWYWEGFGLKLLAKDCKIASYMALGDQLLHIPVIRRGIDNGDYSYLYENIAEEVKSYDISSLNQETVYVDDRGLISDYPRFGSPKEVADAVKQMGIDVVSLANNHALDMELYGIDCSLKTNSNHNIKTLGVHGKDEDVSSPESAVTFMDINGIKLALLSFTYGLNGNPIPKERPFAVEMLSDTKRLESALEYARSEADCVIVYPHWGTENSPNIDEYQEKYTAIFLEHGVDVVIGTHPHVVQDMEMIHGQNHDMLVYYSLGNLVSSEGEAAVFNIVKFPGGRITLTDCSYKPLKTIGDTVVWAD